MPATREVPRFEPVRVRGGHRSARLVRHRRRAVAVGLAVTATALVAAGPRDSDGARGHPRARPPAHTASLSGEQPAYPRRAAGSVTAPVRISDAATVRLLRPGDRVDVIAAEGTVPGGDARVVARGARVTKVPEPVEDGGDSGALVVLSVPRATAARLAGASATGRLAVTLW
ncbi:MULTISPECIES: RcpC/CpaB family pilus assembly protein [unclassified Streptomyces]|uniref:RcpC/CpaB family pilus assembly protein n=1 Tax=unclassified Streptomyces TaxID=2593676 RepID=UPI000BE254D6|nr:RcpC/CpaB family pilus assembly protein [Streptomyces sp. Ag82_G6-1]